MRKPTLIPNWRTAHKLHSMWVAAAGVVLGAWGFVAPDQQAAMLEAVGITPARIPAVLGLLFMVARLVSQKDPP